MFLKWYNKNVGIFTNVYKKPLAFKLAVEK